MPENNVANNFEKKRKKEKKRKTKKEIKFRIGSKVK